MMCIVGGGISSSKFGFSPMSVSGYAMLPAKVVISVADWFSSCCYPAGCGWQGDSRRNDSGPPPQTPQKSPEESLI